MDTSAPTRPNPWGDDVVTGEAVVLELPYAGLGTRALATLVDLLVVGVVLTAGSFAIRPIGGRVDEAAATALILVLVVLVLVGWPTAWETLTRGRTPGKMLLGLRIVRDDAGPIGFRQALTRALVGVVEIWALGGVPALICGLCTSPTQRLGDLAAGSYVIRDRIRLDLPPTSTMPPALADWARGADLGPLPDGWVLAARVLVTRGWSLSPGARWEIATRLAAEVSASVVPRPPAGAPADQVVNAVLTARRERDAARLEREARLRARLFPEAPGPP